MMVISPRSTVEQLSSSCPPRVDSSSLGARAPPARPSQRRHLAPRSPHARSIAKTPRSRRVPLDDTMSTLYISATTSSRTDGTYVGLSTKFETNHETPAYDVSAQTDFVLQKIRGIISRASDGAATLDSVVGATVLLVNVEENFEAMDSVWRSYWPDSDRAPQRNITSVRSLPDPRARVEVKAIAHLDQELSSHGPHVR